jgi:hypothetical protein
MGVICPLSRNSTARNVGNDFVPLHFAQKQFIVFNRESTIVFWDGFNILYLHPSISALRMSQIILAIRLDKSFEAVSISLDTSLGPSGPVAESGHQY